LQKYGHFSAKKTDFSLFLPESGKSQVSRQAGAVKVIKGGGVSDQILGFNAYDREFYVLSCAFDGIRKFQAVFPKMAEMWGPVGVILGGQI
jgi:hypothetical protein